MKKLFAGILLSGLLAGILFVFSCSNDVFFFPPQSEDEITEPVPFFVYVITGVDGNISGFIVDPVTGFMTPLDGFPLASGAVNPSAITTNPDQNMLYTVSQSDETLTVHQVNQNTGAINPISGTPLVIPSGTDPITLTFHPLGNFLFIGTNNSWRIHTYSIHPTTGLPTFESTLSPVPANPRSLRVHPNGLFLYQPAVIGNSLTGYDIDPGTGALSSPSTLSALNWAAGFAIHPNGNLAWLAQAGNVDQVTPFLVDSVTGALTPQTPAASGDDPNWAELHPSGEYLFTANTVSADISVFDVNQTTGALSNRVDFASGNGPNFIQMSPDGDFVFCTNQTDDTVSVFSFDEVTGSLSEVVGSPFAVGVGPRGLAIIPMQ